MQSVVLGHVDLVNPYKYPELHEDFGPIGSVPGSPLSFLAGAADSVGCLPWWGDSRCLSAEMWPPAFLQQGVEARGRQSCTSAWVLKQLESVF